MNIDYADSPFDIYISFEPLIQDLQDKADLNIDTQKEKELLMDCRQNPLLTEGFKNIEEFYKSQALVDRLMAPLFPSLLTNNEI